jgi:predicted RNA-binding protein YlxR (DUF448 family)
MPRRNEPTSRMCLVTREVRPTAELFRFVADPEGRLVLDRKRKLPGRGVWVTARADHVRKAAAKNLFARALRAPVRIDGDLAAMVERQLREAVLGALGLARKAGALIAGFDTVEEAIKGGRVAAVIHARDAGPDGVAKLQSALRRAGIGRQIPILRLLTGEELSLALGRPNVIHAALLAGRASHHALDQIDQFARFLDEPQGEGTSFLARTAEPSAEHQGT